VAAAACAVRGAGTCAIGPAASASGDLAPVTESFETSGSAEVMSIELDDSGASCDLDGLLDGGETGPGTVQVANKGPLALPDTTVTVSSSTPGVVFPGSPSAN